jgi:CRP-like cAMP-binding protein
MTKRREAASADRPTPPVANRLLAALDPDDLSRILPMLHVGTFEVGQILHRPGEPVCDVYFPGDGFCSLLTVLKDGKMVEVATIGAEGMVGISAMMNGQSQASLSMVQARMITCYRMPIDTFRAESEKRGSFSRLLWNYHEALVGFIMQSTACNAVHSVEQRLARWLLMAHDRVRLDDFPLTQEFVAMMLGASRPSVTLVAGALQKAGLITYHRGHLTIVDRRGLEEVACECYRTATDLLEAVTSPAPASP